MNTVLELTSLADDSRPWLTVLVSREGESGCRRLREFFTGRYQERKHPTAYAHGAGFFLSYCDARGISELCRIQPMNVAGYIEQLHLLKRDEA